MNKSTKLAFLLVAMFVPSIALAGIRYNPDHADALKNMHAIESASLNMHYQCKGHSLFITAFATESDVNGLHPSVTGKIASKDKEKSFDISEELVKALSRQNILTGKISVACNAEKGAFQLNVAPSEFSPQNYRQTTVNIYSDGTVSGTRFLQITKG